MTDKEYRIQKKRVGGYLTKWQGPMGLRWWKIDVIWDRSYCENPGIAASTDMTRWRYREADITFYLPKIADEKDEVVEKTVIHELCHVLLSPISTNMEDLNSDYQKQINEFTTELVASAMWWVRVEDK